MRLITLSVAFAFLCPSILAQYNDQIVMEPPQATPLAHAEPSLADLLTIDSSISIFYSYLRDTEMVRRLDDKSTKTTLLAPKNRAVMALPVKPHQDAPQLKSDVTITEEQFDQISKETVQRWISAHIIPKEFTLADGTYETLLPGTDISVVDTRQDSPAPEWTRFLINGDVKIVDMKQARNGVLYVIDGTVKPS